MEHIFIVPMSSLLADVIVMALTYIEHLHICCRYCVLTLKDQTGAHISMSPLMPCNTPRWVM